MYNLTEYILFMKLYTSIKPNLAAINIFLKLSLC
jgi:hypothetical protein